MKTPARRNLPPHHRPPATPIAIVSPPETPNSKNEDTPPAEDYKTPPEETTRLSSSEEQQQPPPPITADVAAAGAADSGVVSKLHGSVNDRGENCDEITSLAVDCVDMNRNGDDLVAESSRGFEDTRSDMIEVVYEGKVKVREISEIEVEKFNVRERGSHWMGRVIESPLKKLKTLDGNVAVESPKFTEELVIESENDSEEGVVGGMENGAHLAKRRLEFIYVNGEGDSASGHTEDIDVVEIEDNDESGMVNGEIFNADQVQSNVGGDDEDEAHRMTDGESGIADQVECHGGGGDEVEVVDRRGTRELPTSMTEPWENAEWDKEREKVRSEGRKRKSNGDPGNGGAALKDKGDMGTLLEVLKLIAEEVRSDHHRGAVDIIETAKSHGMTFPQPRWMAHVGG
ncbi:hypothetical protein Ancab_032901 [Ancistrocladus abbreviatus]